MKQIQIDFNNNKFLCDLCNDNKDTFIKIEKELRKRYGLKKGDYYITNKYQLINRDWNFNEKYEYCSNYQIHIKVKGGFINLLIKLVKGIIQIAVLFTKIPGFIIWLFEFLLWVITEVLNPFIFFQDLARSVFAIIKMLIAAFLDLFTGIGKYIINLVAAPFINSFWGYTPKREKNSFATVLNGYKNDNFLIIKKSKNKFDEIFKTGDKIIIQSNQNDNFQITTVVSTEVSDGTEVYGKIKLVIGDQLKYNYPSGSIVAKPNRYASDEYISSKVKGEFAQISTSNGAEKFVNVKMPQKTFNNNFKIGEEIILQNKNSNTQKVKIVETSNVSDTETSVTLDQAINIELGSGSILGKPIRNQNTTIRANCNNKTCVQFQNPLSQISGCDKYISSKVEGEFVKITGFVEKVVNIKISKASFNNNFKIGDEIILQNNKSNTQKAKIVEISVISDNETSVILDQAINISIDSASILGKPVKNISGCDGLGLDIKIDLSAKSESGLSLSVIILTVLLPPLGLFMELGLKNWINIALCALLTAFYYFPGLIYALIIIYC